MSKITSSEQLLAEEKALAIINSCKTPSHFNTARNYLEIFHKKFVDPEAYRRLWNVWKKSLN